MLDLYIGSQDMTDWGKGGRGILGEGTRSYITHGKHTSGSKGNCSMCSIGSGALAVVELFSINQFRVTQGKDRPLSGYSCRVYEPFPFLTLGH